MKADDVMDLIRHYRHDLLNELQLIHGYASMGKPEKINEKVKRMIEHYQEERKLFGFQCPYFTIWLMSFNWEYSQFQINYRAEDIGDISNMDLTLFSSCKEIFSIIPQHTDENHVYKGELEIQKQHELRLEFVFYGPFHKPEKLNAELLARNYTQSVQIDQEKCQFILAFQMR